MLLTHIAGESLPHGFGDLPPYEAHHGERSSGKVSVDRTRWCRYIDFYSLYFVSYAVNKRGKIIHEAINSIVKGFEATYLDPTPLPLFNETMQMLFDPNGIYKKPT